MAIVPSHHDQHIVVVQKPLRDFKTFRRNISTNFVRALESFAHAHALVMTGTQEDKFYGTAHQPSFLRQPWGCGWMLVGDSGCHKDSITAQGMSDALIDSRMASEALSGWMSGNESWDTAMSTYHSSRDSRLRPIYHRALDLADLRGPDEASVERLQEIASDEAEMRKFFSVDAGIDIPR